MEHLQVGSQMNLLSSLGGNVSFKTGGKNNNALPWQVSKGIISVFTGDVQGPKDPSGAGSRTDISEGKQGRFGVQITC